MRDVGAWMIPGCIHLAALPAIVRLAPLPGLAAVAYLALAGVLTRELLHVRARGLGRSCARLSVFGLVGAVALVGLAV
jgi:hypothetical protein